MYNDRAEIRRKKRVRSLQYRSMLKGAFAMMIVTVIASKSNKIPQKASAFDYKETLSHEELMERERITYSIEEGIIKPAYMSKSKMDELGVTPGETIEINNKGVFIVRSISELRENAIILYDDNNGKDVDVYKYYK